MVDNNSNNEIHALKVHQWLDEWEKVKWSKKEYRNKPIAHFYIFSLSAAKLRALSGIARRTTEGGLRRYEDYGIQRRHDKKRSGKITQFVKYGFPWSELSEQKRKSKKFEDLRKPGWLPTSIVVNIMTEKDQRPNRSPVADQELIKVKDIDDTRAAIVLPKEFAGSEWRPSDYPPIEVIDGQHRLWAFEEEIKGGDFELPVVAFVGLDISWQAYLFWTINIKPVKINASLAFDLYPLLRTEDWLERFEGPAIYRETRAQEIVGLIWSHLDSPWYQRINMLGDQGRTWVSQAAWIRTLLATYIKTFEGRGVRKIGGVFGAPAGDDKLVIPWTKTQQTAFIIYLWKKIEEAIKKAKHDWTKQLRNEVVKEQYSGVKDLAFAGPNTLLNTDVGVRGVMLVTNDLFYLAHKELELKTWGVEQDTSGDDIEEVTEALNLFNSSKVINGFVEDIAAGLADYDWRTANAEGLTEAEKTAKLAFRGSGGYRELRRQLLKLLSDRKGDLGKFASDAYTKLGFDK